MSLQDKNQPSHYFSLQPSEMAVFRAACEIYAAYVASGQVSEENKKDFYRRAISEAISIGRIVEKSIESDDELKSNSSSQTPTF